jgi:hypothetical protein
VHANRDPPDFLGVDSVAEHATILSIKPARMQFEGGSRSWSDLEAEGSESRTTFDLHLSEETDEAGPQRVNLKLQLRSAARIRIRPFRSPNEMGRRIHEGGSS